MTDWSLPRLLESLHTDIQHKLKIVRQTMGHAVAKGDASEGVWLEMLQNYIPERYQIARTFVIDSRDTCSRQMDVVIFDRQYSPFIFKYQGELVVPAESVYAVFEAKQTINAAYIVEAKEKIASVRRLYRTSLPIPHAGGTYPPKPLPHIIGGILAFDSDWTPAFGKSLEDALRTDNSDERIDVGCVAAHGHFGLSHNKMDYAFHISEKAATAFLFGLISQLQASATVPMIDVQAYAEWLTK